MQRKIVFFTALCVLLVFVGLPLTLRQNWDRFSTGNKPCPVLNDTLSRHATVFNEQGSLLLQELTADSARLMFRFPLHACSCLELDFANDVQRSVRDTGENKVFVVVAATNNRDVLLFRQRTKITCPVYGTKDTLLAAFDNEQMPYACLVFPDMTAKHIITIPTHPKNIDELINYAKENIP